MASAARDRHTLGAARGRAQMTSIIAYAVILTVGVSLYLVKRYAKRPEVFYLAYTAVMTAGALTLLSFLVYGAVTGPESQQGASIGQAIIVGCFVVGLLFGTVFLTKLVRGRGRD